MFQSTHPRGVRPIKAKPSRYFLWFQSTHPRGVRQIIVLPVPPKQTFQSTHPRGVRRILVKPILSCNMGFNPRTREGCDDTGSRVKVSDLEFQSTHPRGVRLLYLLYLPPPI